MTFLQYGTGPMIQKLIFGLLFAVIGYCVAFFLGKPILDDARKSMDWPSVAGVIERSKVVSKRKSDGTMYSADVAFAYEVDGQGFKGSNVTFGGGMSSSNSRMANSVVSRYRKGQKVDVFHDPEEPGNSVLEPGASWKSWLVFGIGLLFLGVGVLMGVSPLFTIIFALIFAGGRKRS